MVCLERDQANAEGKTKGSLTSDPKEINDILVRTWNQVYRGNGDDTEATANQFMDKYHRHTMRSHGKSGTLMSKISRTSAWRAPIRLLG